MPVRLRRHRRAACARRCRASPLITGANTPSPGHEPRSRMSAKPKQPHVSAGPLDVWKLHVKPRASFLLVGSVIASAQMPYRAGVRAQGSMRQGVLESSNRTRNVAMLVVYQASEWRLSVVCRSDW